METYIGGGGGGSVGHRPLSDRVVPPPLTPSLQIIELRFRDTYIDEEKSIIFVTRHSFLRHAVVIFP